MKKFGRIKAAHCKSNWKVIVLLKEDGIRESELLIKSQKFSEFKTDEVIEFDIDISGKRGNIISNVARISE